MGVLIRPRFGQPCFDCGEPGSTQRIPSLQRTAESQQRRWLKSDLACVVCANKREVNNKTAFEHLPANSANGGPDGKRS
jgi:hypothetical protein